jgi:prepilin-type N-terminal cleavage/methylation domain-containing protein
MNGNSGTIRGFTLLETVIAITILASGIVAVAHVISSAVRTNTDNRLRTAATFLLVEKLEQFRSAHLKESIWRSGGSLNANAPSDGYFDYIVIGDDGSLRSDSISATAPFLRVWQIRDADPRSVTVVVYGRHTLLDHTRRELARATTMRSASFQP